MAPYFIRNLVPPKQAHNHPHRPLSQVLGGLTFIQWLQFFSGYKISPTIGLAETDLGGCRRWLAWTCDAIDFFNVALSVTALGAQFDKDNSSIVCFSLLSLLSIPDSFMKPQTTAITLTLLVRSIGAVSTFFPVF